MVNRNPPVRPALQHLQPDERSLAFTHRPCDQQVQKSAVILSLTRQDRSAEIVALRAAKRFPSIWSVQRYKRRLVWEGNVAPYRHTGNRRATVLRGINLILLAYFRVVFPKALLAEVAAFLWNAWGRFQNPPILYTLPDISKAKTRLGLTRKKGSTTAYQAFLPQNLARRQAFGTRPWLYGIADIDRADMIDIDESAFFLETTNWGYGKAIVNDQARQAGNYGHSTKWTPIMAAAGQPGPNDWYAEFTRRPGTDIVTFANFVQTVLNMIGPGAPGNRRCLTFDNITAHKHPVVLQMILNAGHIYAFRAPYYPVDGPIEYIFNAITGKLTTNMHQVRIDSDLVTHMMAAINSFDDFVGFFHDVGFW